MLQNRGLGTRFEEIQEHRPDWNTWNQSTSFLAFLIYDATLFAMTPSRSHKLYCYVDETGQDTNGELFLVALVVTGSERDTLSREALEIERASGKGATKWHKSEIKRKVAYLRRIFASPLFAQSLFFTSYKETKGAYLDLMVLATARAINYKMEDNKYKTTVIVDGLNKTEIHHFTRGLRSLRISVRTVRGVRDESDPLIRLADAIAGFVRDVIEKKPYALEIQKDLHTENKLTHLQ